jgi:hypothetical protein
MISPAGVVVSISLVWSVNLYSARDQQSALGDQLAKEVIAER